MSKFSGKKRKKQKQPLFAPDNIVTTIHQAINRDLSFSNHEYVGCEDTVLYAHNRQAADFVKKYVGEHQNQDGLEADVFQKFFEINRSMIAANRVSYPDYNLRIQPNVSERDRILLRARALVHTVLHDVSEEEWFQECKHSSGSSIGVPYRDTSIERKFSYPLSTTARVKPLFERYMAGDFQLSDAVKKYNSENPVGSIYNVIRGSRATTVDKTATKRRMICVEPTVNMFLQQGLMQVMYKRLKAVGLDVETLPERHKFLARESSITGRNATIDWSSASDCVSIELLRFLLPPKWFYYVDMTRSKFTTIDGRMLKLGMISTMGNAVTFPLETLVFWTFSQACLISDTRDLSLFTPCENWKKTSVFGDDCILPSDRAAVFIAALEEVGFRVNQEKTHMDQSQFRESCGGDYLAGYNVRPYYIKAPTSTKRSALEPWLYIIMNQLTKRYITYFGTLTYVYDRSLFSEIAKLFREYQLEIKLVPPWFPDDSGFKMSSDILRLCRVYGFKLSPLHKDMHGTYSFRFCRFQYWQSYERNDQLRFVNWLRKPIITHKKLFEKVPENLVREKGGYVVARGTTGHWSVPQICGELD